MNQENLYQKRYWNILVELKTHIHYLDIYFLGTERIDRGLNMFFAITSSSSIGGWLIWDKYKIIWAFIIGLSQVFNAIKGFLPYKKRLSKISGYARDLSKLLLFGEEKWFNVSSGNLIEEEIHNLYIKIKKDKLEITNKYFRDSTLPKKKRYYLEAKEQAITYFKNNYDLED